MFNHLEVNSDKTDERLKLNTFKVIFTSCRQNFHCKQQISQCHSFKDFCMYCIQLCSLSCQSYHILDFNVFIQAVTQWKLSYSMSNHTERFSYGLEKVGWKFTVHVKQLCWDTLPSWLLIEIFAVLAIHTKTFSQEPKLNFCSHDEILMLFHVCALRLNLQCEVLQTFKCFCTNCKYLSEAF